MFDENLCRPDPNLIKQAHRNGQSKLGHHIRWRDDRGDHKRQHYEVAPKIAQLLDRDNPHARKYDYRDGDFERESEREEHHQHETQISLDVRRRRDALRRELLDEGEDLAEHEEVAEGHAQQEEQRA